MEVIGLLLVGLVLAVVIGLVLGVAAFVQVRGLKSEVLALRRQLGPGPQVAVVGADVGRNRTSPPASAPKVNADPAPPDFELDLDIEPAMAAPSTSAPTSSPIPSSIPSPTAEPNATEAAESQFWQHLQQQWMVWLGGACVGLAGIFLAKYSIEQGLLGPSARIVAGILTGAILHAAALWLRARQGNHASFAALAGGGSITLFATLLAALHMYQMLSPAAVFVALALVAVATLWLALLHGPVLAAIGMLGAYSVPLLVSTGSGNVLLAMLYALIISAAVLWLLRMVYRPWLWWGCMAGALGWWALSFAGENLDAWRPLYLAALAYGVLAIPRSNWLLMQRLAGACWPITLDDYADGQPPFTASLLALWAALCATILVGGWSANWITWLLLPLLTAWLASHQPRFTSFTWLGYGAMTAALLLSQLHMGSDGQWLLTPIAVAEQANFFTFLAVHGLLLIGLAVWNVRRGSALSWWASLLAMMPVLQLLHGYLLASDYTTVWQWACAAFVLAAGALWIAFLARARGWQKPLVAWLILAGHFAYALLAAWLLEEASLTLAIASQLLSLAWVMHRFEMPELGWLFKIVVIIVVVRLTFNPWLASYSQAGHWTLWTYGGATLMCYVASRWLASQPKLALWAEAAALHLFVLTLWSEARYWLHDGQVYRSELSLVEAVLNQSLFAALGLVYHWKSKISEHLALWYRTYAAVLLMAAGLHYALLVLAFLASDVWLWSAVNSQPLFNLLLMAFGLPVLWFLASYRFGFVQFRRWAAAGAAISGLLFITIEIRHLWQGSVRLSGGVLDGEMYTYSVVWLICAVFALLGGSWRFGRQCYQWGMALLAVVILKIFLLDMGDLEGLWRVASFMGLGLALLGVAFLHQKIQALRPET